MRVAYDPPRLLNAEQGPGQSLFSNYLRTQAAQVKSRPVIAAALKRDEVKRLGLENRWPDPAAWRWGSVHQAVFAHPFLASIPVLGALTTSRIAVPGDGSTLYRGGTNDALESVHGASYRGVYDLADLDRSLFIEYVRKASVESTVPFLRGVFLGLLAELREITAEELAADLAALAKAPPDVMVTAGDFLDGILAVSRTSIMLGADALILALDELLRAAEWEPFLVMVPRLRAAFERMHAS